MTAAPQQQQRRPRPVYAPRPAAGPASGPATLARTVDVSTIEGTFSSALDVAARMKIASEKCHLIAPLTLASRLQEGVALAFSPIYVDIERDTYPQQGGRALLKVALDRIAANAGVSWVDSRRTDDARHPHYCAWRAVCVIRDLDGTERCVPGDAEMDLRDGSPRVLEMFASTSDKDPQKTLRTARKFILRATQARAHAAAIRSLGIRGVYTLDELAKPFVSVKPVLDTASISDPETKREIERGVLLSMVQGRAALFGAPSAPAVRERVIDVDPIESAPVATQVSSAAAKPAPASTATAATPVSEADPFAAEEQTYSGVTIPFGREKGTAIEEATDGGLQWVHDAISEKIAKGTNNPRFLENDRALLAAIQAEMEWRAGGNEYDEDAPENQLPEGYGR